MRQQKTASLDPFLVAYVVSEFAGLESPATRDSIKAHLRTAIASRAAPDGRDTFVREYNRLAASANTPGERTKWEREAKRTVLSTKGVDQAATVRIESAEARRRIAGIIQGRDEVWDLLLLYAHDRVAEARSDAEAARAGVGWLSAKAMHAELEVVRDAANAAIEGIERLRDAVAKMAPESAALGNRAAGGIGFGPVFAQKHVDAAVSAIPSLRRLSDLAGVAVTTSRQRARRPPDTPSRYLALRVLALAWVAGIEDEDARLLLRDLHTAVRGHVAKVAPEASAMVKDPLPLAQKDLEAFRRIRGTFTVDEIRIGLKKSQILAAIASTPSKRGRVPAKA